MNQKKIHFKLILLLILICFNLNLTAQNEAAKPDSKKNKELKFSLNDSGSNYVKFTFLNQVWLRYNESNPGTLINDNVKNNTWDIGLRRTRIQVFGQISDRIFVYTQFGQNNLSSISPRKQGLFFLDAVGEFKIKNELLSIGTGLTGWNGVSRYAAPGISSILSMDAPLYQQTTNDVSDQFLRKLSVYAKGKIGKLDYRVVVSDPMSIQNSNIQSNTIDKNSLFSSEPPNPQFHGYFMYQFLDQESNLIAYNQGSYLGKKEVLNIGAGFLVQKDAMWHLSENNQDTINTNLLLLAVDFYYDKPLSKEKGTSITTYLCFSYNDFGINYVRNLGVMNPGNNTDQNASFNGSGNAFPMIGTGNTLYGQIGYHFKDDLLSDLGTLQPYFAVQYSNFKLLNEPMLLFESGLNYLIDGNKAKLTLNYQNRPVFKVNSIGQNNVAERKAMWVLQFQFLI